MTSFSQQDGALHCEGVSLEAIAQTHGTPTYVYSHTAIKDAFLSYQNAVGDHPHLICYAVKANSNLSILRTLASMGAGFDVVSVGELERVMVAGGDAGKVVFSGVGKTASEMRRAYRQESNVSTSSQRLSYGYWPLSQRKWHASHRFLFE